jgi:hypothetical protein
MRPNARLEDEVHSVVLMQHRGLSREKRRFIGAMEEKESTEALS